MSTKAQCYTGLTPTSNGVRASLPPGLGVLPGLPGGASGLPGGNTSLGGLSGPSPDVSLNTTPGKILYMYVM